MNKTLWKKMFREMWFYKGRTFFAMLGILIGVASLGTVLSSYSILNREMTKNFMQTNPSSMIFIIKNMDESVTNIIKKSYSNIEVEFGKTIQARISRGDGTYGTIYLRAIGDFNNQEIDKFKLEQGKYPLNSKELVLERYSLKILKNIKSGINESISLLLPGKKEVIMKSSGLVHAPALAPASMENYSYGFVSLDGLRELGYEGWYDELRIVRYENRMNKISMEKMAQQIKEELLKSGYQVESVNVPTPGKHPHASQLSSLLFLLQAFAVVSIFTASLIIINLIIFIISKQEKQIAVMKTLGATNFNIVSPYLLYVLFISLGGILLSIPVGVIIGINYSKFAANILNFKIYSDFIPLWVFASQILIGIIIPILSTCYPVLKASKKEIIEGLNEDISISGFEKFNAKERKSSFNSKFTIPFKNIFRKKVRTILAVSALVAGGVLFISSKNIIASINSTVDSCSEKFVWDYDLTLSGIYSENIIKEAFKKVKGIENFEIWQVNTAKILKGNKEKSYVIKIMPDDTKMFLADSVGSINKIAGKNAIIVNKSLTQGESWIKKGSQISVSVGGYQPELQVAEVVNEVPALPTIYISKSIFERLFPVVSQQLLLAKANTRDASKQREITKAIESTFNNANINLSENWNIYLVRKAFADHLKVIMSFLTAVSFVAVVIGGLSIDATISINISERKREMGVLRAVGVSNRQIITMVLLEVILMGLLSWIIGVIIAYPVSMLIGNYFGQIFLNSNLQNVISVSGILIWAVIAVGSAIIAGILPAQNASKAPLIEMLKYE